MIKETGKIISIKELQGQKVAVVECISKSACSGCHNQDSCGVGTVSKSHSDKTHHFEVPFKEWMHIDEAIELQITNRDLISSAIIAYLVPLVFFVGGAILTKEFTLLNEGQMILVSVISAAVGFLFARLLSNKYFPQKQSDNIISAKIHNNAQ